MSFKLLIVNFHYFREETPAAGIYPVSKQAFINQLDVLSKSFTFCSQTEIIDWQMADRYPAGKFCLITFDDGLAEQMIAFDLLLKKGIPAVFYIPSGPFLSNAPLTVHKLHYMRSAMSDEELNLHLQRNPLFVASNFDESLMSAQYRYDNALAKKIKYFFNFILKDAEADEIIEQIFSDCVADELSFTRNFYMTKEDIKMLSTYQMMGSHGRDHKPLATLTKDECRRDIIDSLSFLENCTGSSVRSFSYPFGSKAAVNSDVIGQFTGTSVQFATTMFRGINTEQDLRARFLLKRVDTNDAPGGKNPLNDLVCVD